jgi:hypothetical protein
MESGLVHLHYGHLSLPHGSIAIRTCYYGLFIIYFNLVLFVLAIIYIAFISLQLFGFPYVALQNLRHSPVYPFFLFRNLSFLLKRKQIETD